MAENFHYSSPFVAMDNNPITLIDPTGMYCVDPGGLDSWLEPSTHTDKEGNVMAVYDDGDLGVYKHTGKDAKNHQGPLSKDEEGTEKIGKTEHWDEFINPETGEAEGQIAFGESWEDAINELHTLSHSMNLKGIAANSTSNKPFDLKMRKKYAQHGPMTGKLLNGKYASARSAGNFLAGYNGSHGKMFGVGISWLSYIKMAGAVHQKK